MKGAQVQPSLEIQNDAARGENVKGKNVLDNAAYGGGGEESQDQPGPHPFSGSQSSQRLSRGKDADVPGMAVHRGDEEHQGPPSVHPSSSSQRLPRKKDSNVPDDAVPGENEEPQDQPCPHPPSGSQSAGREGNNVPDDDAQE